MRMPAMISLDLGHLLTARIEDANEKEGLVRLQRDLQIRMLELEQTRLKLHERASDLVDREARIEQRELRLARLAQLEEPHRVTHQVDQ